MVWSVRSMQGFSLDEEVLEDNFNLVAEVIFSIDDMKMSATIAMPMKQ